MNTPTPTQVIDLLVSLRQVAHGALYPPDLLAARRAAFVAQLHNPMTARLAAIDHALGQEYDLETVNNLLEEKAEILAYLEKE